MTKPKDPRKRKPGIKVLKSNVAAKKATLENTLEVDRVFGDKNNPLDDRRYEKHDRADDDETMRRLARKAILKAEKVLESINVSVLPHTHKAAAFDVLIKNARLLMGLTTSNVGKVDLRVVALKVLDERMQGKKTAKKDDTANEPINAEYSDIEMLSGPETIHAKN